MKTSHIKTPSLPSGTEDFAEMRKVIIKPDSIPFTIADKTEFLPDLLRSVHKVIVFTRPIRFMKSSTLSMLDRFLSVKDVELNKSLFNGLEIGKDIYAGFRSNYQGQFPIIHLTLKDLETSS